MLLVLVAFCSLCLLLLLFLLFCSSWAFLACRSRRWQMYTVPADLPSDLPSCTPPLWVLIPLLILHFLQTSSLTRRTSCYSLPSGLLLCCARYIFLRLPLCLIHSPTCTFFLLWVILVIVILYVHAKHHLQHKHPHTVMKNQLFTVQYYTQSIYTHHPVAFRTTFGWNNLN